MNLLETPSTLPSLSASTPPARLRLGIAGLNFGRHILTEILNGGGDDAVEIVALCDLDPARLQECSRKIPEAAVFTSLDDMLNSACIDAVGLFTGPVGRAELIERILDAGCHVMTTKPLERDGTAVRRVLEEAARRGLVVHCNSPTPLPTEDIRLIQKWAVEYHLGRPVGARADVWVSYREAADGSWYDDPEACPVAPIYRLGIYLINDLTRLWGPVEQVTVLQSRIFTGRPTADNAQVGVLFENGAIANVFASFCVLDGDHYRNSLTLNYEKGTIYRNAGPARIEKASESRLTLVQAIDNARFVRAETTASSSGASYSWRYFAEAARGRRSKEELTPVQAAEGIRVINAIAAAVREGGSHRLIR